MAKKKIYTNESGEDGDKDNKDSRRNLNKTIKKSSHKRGQQSGERKSLNIKNFVPLLGKKEKKRFETMARILVNLVDKHDMDDIKARNITDEIMKKYPFDNEEQIIKETIATYEEKEAFDDINRVLNNPKVSDLLPPIEDDRELNKEFYELSRQLGNSSVSTPEEFQREMDNARDETSQMRGAQKKKKFPTKKRKYKKKKKKKKSKKS